jgi:hypothetical protein
MKKILSSLLFAISLSSCFAQYIKPNNSYGVIYNRVRPDSTQLIPTGCGAASLRSTDQKMSALYFDSCNKRLWVYNPALATWDTAHLGITGSAVNIYNSNGTITGNRTVDADGNSLTFYHPSLHSIQTSNGLFVNTQDSGVYINSGGGASTGTLLSKTGRIYLQDGLDTLTSDYDIVGRDRSNGLFGKIAGGGGGSTTLQGAYDNGHVYDKDWVEDVAGFNKTIDNAKTFNVGQNNTNMGNNSMLIGYGNATPDDSIIVVGFNQQGTGNQSYVYLDGVNQRVFLVGGKSVSTNMILGANNLHNNIAEDSVLTTDVDGNIKMKLVSGGGSGTVTSIATNNGTGITGGTITTTGTLAIDTVNTIATKDKVKKDSAVLQTSIATKQPQLNGTGFVKASGTTISYDNSTYLTTAVTSVATGLGLSGGTITGAGTLLVDTASASIISRQRAAATYQPIVSLTTTGSSGAATFTSNTLNVPNYTLAGLGGWSLASGGTLTGTNTITAGSNPLIISTGVTTGTGTTAGMQVAANSLTTGIANDYSSSSITTGNILKLTSTSTAANAFSLLNINSSGANANSTRTATGQTISVTNTGTTSTNVGLSVSASGATNNYGLIVPNGMVGIGTTTPTLQFQVEGPTAGARFVRSGGNEAFIQLTEPTLAFGGGIRGNAAAAGIQFTNLSSSVEWARFDGSTGIGRFGIGVISPTSLLHLAAGTATAGTAPLGFTTTSAALLTTPVSGKMEVLVDSIYYTGSGANRRQLTQSLYGTVTLDFGNTAAGTSTDLTVTVTGAADGDVVSLGVVNASTVANGSFSAWVSAANTVTVRYANNSLVTAYDPASGAFKIRVIK